MNNFLTKIHSGISDITVNIFLYFTYIRPYLYSQVRQPSKLNIRTAGIQQFITSIGHHQLLTFQRVRTIAITKPNKCFDTRNNCKETSLLSVVLISDTNS